MFKANLKKTDKTRPVVYHWTAGDNSPVALKPKKIEVSPGGNLYLFQGDAPGIYMVGRSAPLVNLEFSYTVLRPGGQIGLFKRLHQAVRWLNH